MSHEIYENRFASYREAAWHRLGKVFTQPLNANQAFELMGPYEVTKEQLYFQAGMQPQAHTPSIQGPWPMEPVYSPVDGKYVIRGHFPDTGKTEVYGLADERYELISPRQLVNLWDTLIPAKIETMGCLQNGKRFFLTTELPGFDVRGDEHRNYLSILSPHGPGQSLIGLISPVRVVCANTAQMAIEAAQQQCKVPHFKGAFNKVGTWLKEQYESVMDRTEALQQALEILADRNVTTNAQEQYLEDLFPMPEDDAEKAADLVADNRYQVARLFNGDATGFDTKAFKGTYFGLYNSVVEHLDYGSKAKQTVFTGAAAGVKEKAFDLAMQMATK